jgi:hypothetical protein
MHDIRADIEKNRLYVTIGTLTDEAEIKTIVEKIKKSSAGLKPDFSCLTDLREYDLETEDLEMYIVQAQKAMVAAGLGRVVRVRKQFDSLGHFQFDKSSVSVGYHAMNATSIEDAEKMLDED